MASAILPFMENTLRYRSVRVPLTDQEFKELKLITLDKQTSFAALTRKALETSASTRKAFTK